MHMLPPLRRLLRRPRAASRDRGPQRAFQPLSPSLQENLTYFKECLGGTEDLTSREFRLGGGRGVKGALLYLKSITNCQIVNEQVLKPIFFGVSRQPWQPRDLLQFLEERVLAVEEIRRERDARVVLLYITRGCAALFLEGAGEALICSVAGWEKRGISEPVAEGVVRGPRESFIEDLSVNLSLIRRRLRTPALREETFLLGRYTQTRVALVYIEGVAMDQIVAEVRTRVSRIDVDGVIDTGVIEEFIEDCPWSPFAQVSYSERPDRVAADLLEGRVAVFADGSPVALLAPALLVQFLQAAEDYYERYPIAAGIRILRFLALLAMLSLPSAYVAVTTFHHEMLPARMLFNVLVTREGVPFPSLAEALLMEFVFEALREAGIRLPRPVGQAVSIVGGLVVGQAAISAGLVSPLMVVVVALTGIASFVIPSYAMAITFRLLRFPVLILSGMLGFYGLMAGLMSILIHLTTLRSFGIPYLAPLTPGVTRGLRDVFFRAPHWALDHRPAFVGKENLVRQAPGQRPAPQPLRPGRRGRRNARRR